MSNRSTRARRGLSALAVAALSTGVLMAPNAADAAPATARHAYPGSVPSFVSARADVGPTADTTVEGEVYLPLRDEAGAQNLATAVSTPGNAKYGKFLSPAKWIAKYAPSQSDFNAVKKYLKNSGQTIFATPASREYIVFRGPAASTPAAFGTTLHDYRVGSKLVSAPSGAPTLPASIAAKVSAISLGNSRAALTTPSNVQLGTGTGAAAAPRATPKAASAPACSSYFGQNSGTLPTAYGRTSFPTAICGYLPGQLRSAGDVNKQINSGHDGTGQTIAIVDAYASPTIVQDTNDYMRAVGSPLLTRFRQIAPGPADFQDQALCQQPSGWQAEESIDVQSAHSIAPGANILYVGGFNCGGGLDIALSKIVDRGLADIVSNSYGDQGEGVPDDVVRGEQNIHIQAAGEGIGLYFSSGDSGDESVNLGYTSPDFPASSPFVTAVGGTSEAIAANGRYQFETGWGDILDQVANNQYAAALPGNLYGGGAGGGVSALFAQPAYQQGVVPDALATSVDGTPSRVVPDIADLADPYTGFQIALRPIIDDTTLQTGPFEYETYGGTSLASPIAAAKMALVQDATGSRVGFANPALYQASTDRPAAFHDVVTPASPVALYYRSARSGNLYLNTLNQGLSLTTAQGYDDITGVGSLIVPTLASYLGSHAG
ncbi:MAG: S53 family peptidase [Jatrophihabitantaceae bacterium]